MKSSLVIGLIVGLAIIFFVIYLNEDISLFLNYSGLLITIGGTLCAILIYFSYNDIKHAFSSLGQIISEKDYSEQEIIDSLIEINNEARKNGVNNITNVETYSNFPFLIEGMSLVVDNMDSTFIRDVMLRENRGLTQTQVAKILKVDRSSVSNYERGTRKLDQDQIVALVKALNTTADYFLGLSEHEEKGRK
jgi:flagellar motor component MotA